MVRADPSDDPLSEADMPWQVSDPELVVEAFPSTDGRDRAYRSGLATELRGFDVPDSAVELTERLLRADDPLSAGSDPVRAAMLQLGATDDEANDLVADLELIRAHEAMARGPNYSWGRDPEATYRRAEYDAQLQRDRTRRQRLWEAILQTLGVNTPIGEPHVEVVQFTVLVLASPRVDGSSVVWTSSRSTEAATELTLTLLGSGLGATKKVSIRAARTETCKDGEALRVRYGAPILVQPVGHVVAGAPKVVGYRREVAESSPGTPVGGITVEALQSQQLAAMAGQFAEKEDRTAATSSVKLDVTAAVTGERHVSTGFTFNGADLGMSGSLTGGSGFDLTTTLPGGHCYWRYLPNDAYGVLWDMRR